MQEIDEKKMLRRLVSDLNGVTYEQIAALQDLGISTVADLIKHLPFRYETHHGSVSIKEAAVLLGDAEKMNNLVTIEGVIDSVRPCRRRGKRTRIEAVVEDGQGKIQVNWFNQPWIAKKLHPEMTVRLYGSLSRHNGTLQMNNPRWEEIDEASVHEGVEGELCPVYPSNDKINSTAIARLVRSVLNDSIKEIEDHLSDSLRSELEMPSLSTAYNACHHPDDESEAKEGRRRIAFDELFLLQLGVMIKRHHRRERLKSRALIWNEDIQSRIESRIHFTLTDCQRYVIEEIAADITTSIPMNRLLQGDVGSGKTVVALHAMLMAVTSKQQAALMAPTELLAEQHFNTISSLLEGSQVTVALLTSSLKAKERSVLIDDISNGKVDIVIGTHALLTHDVIFSNIAVAITDEQHRFGVEQRATLRNKGSQENEVPHTLVMTATPIPRTMSLTIFGDLDVSTINKLPPGRTPIKTKQVQPDDAGKVYGYAKELIEQGRQCYVVVPLVETTDIGLKSAESHAEEIQRTYFEQFKVGVVHGRLSTQERALTMQQFRKGEIDVLVATTVIEVGVDVPNASMIIIEHAERFGLAQLHQLRGRVGRGEHASICALIANPQTQDSSLRLEAIVQTTDGFLIAERDLEIRGPGELFGAKQSGIAPFSIARFPEDFNLLKLARRIATRIIQDDPTLSTHELLRARLLRTYGESLGLGDVA